MALPVAAFDPTKTVIPRKSFLRLIPALPLIAATGTGTTDVFAAASHPLVNGQLVLVSAVTGLTGFTAGVYYVVNIVAGVSFQLSTTLGGSPSLFTADGSCTVQRIADLVGKNSNYKQTIEKIMREVPDADGILRPDRIVVIKRMQDFEFETEEIASLAPAFGQTTDISGNLTDGTAQLYITDPDDASNKVALATNQFSASWQLADGYNFAAGATVVAKIVINSREKVTITPDATP